MKRTTERTTKRTTWSRIIVGAAIAVALAPGTALAASGGLSAGEGAELVGADASGEVQEVATATSSASASCLLSSIQTGVSDLRDDAVSSLKTNKVQAAVKTAVAEQTDKVLSYDPALIAAIGTQESTGHSICCPSFSCAYADAVMDGTVHDHSYYGCGCCVWTDWGGGNSSFRSVGTGEQLLREAYDQIAAGKPTVIHVSASYGEHWIALIGYQGAADPDNLTLANFIALDPWDGAQITASDRFSLYGDGCEHISER